MIQARSIAGGLIALGALALAGCQTTQDKAKAVQERAADLQAAQVPLTIPKPNKDVQVIDQTIISDENGSAVAVEARNTTSRTLVGVPILIDVRDAQGKPVFKNDAFGLDFALNHIPLMKPGETVTWVNDQILSSGEPTSVKATVGQPDSVDPPQIPRIAVSEPRLHDDPSGVEVEGSVTNQSQLDQRKLVLFAVARRGGEIIAAGRGQVKNLRAEKRSFSYNIFFIGDPQGADVEIEAPPTTFE